MKVFYSTSYPGHYPVPHTFIAVAPDADLALSLLKGQMVECGLWPCKDWTDADLIEGLKEIDTTTMGCAHFDSGDY